MKKLIYIFVAILLLTSCEDKKEKLESDFYSVQMINKSGVEVEVYNLNDDKGDFPERLTLMNGKTYQWKIKKDAVSPLTQNILGTASVRFSPYYMAYEGSEMQDDIDPRWFENYERIERDGEISYQYTFTKEKYQSVVDRNKKEWINYKCVMVNKSGVEVTVEIKVTDDYYDIAFPAKLAILPDAKFEWRIGLINSPSLVDVKMSYPKPVEVPFGTPSPEVAKITYGEDVVVVYDIPSVERDPRQRENYVREVIDKENEVFTYTFSEEDYQNALKKNVNL